MYKPQNMQNKMFKLVNEVIQICSIRVPSKVSEN